MTRNRQQQLARCLSDLDLNVKLLGGKQPNGAGTLLQTFPDEPVTSHVGNIYIFIKMKRNKREKKGDCRDERFPKNVGSGYVANVHIVIIVVSEVPRSHPHIVSLVVDECITCCSSSDACLGYSCGACCLAAPAPGLGMQNRLSECLRNTLLCPPPDLLSNTFSFLI